MRSIACGKTLRRWEQRSLRKVHKRFHPLGWQRRLSRFGRDEVGDISRIPRRWQSTQLACAERCHGFPIVYFFSPYQVGVGVRRCYTCSHSMLASICMPIRRWRYYKSTLKTRLIASPAKLCFNKSNALSRSSTNGQNGHYAPAAFWFANRTPYAANGVYIKPVGTTTFPLPFTRWWGRMIQWHHSVAKILNFISYFLQSKTHKFVATHGNPQDFKALFRIVEIHVSNCGKGTLHWRRSVRCDHRLCNV